MTVHTLADDRPDYLRLKAIEEQIKKLQEQRATLIEKLTPHGNAYFEYEGSYYKALLIAPTSPKIPDLISLKKYHPDVFAKVTKVVLDKTKLRALIDTHQLPDEVDVEWEQIKGRIKVSQVTTEGDESTESEASVA